MMCSLCGEGATDMQEFLKHHTEVHPDADKGRYKRREQPVISKWINGFLYAQATIIKAFPPREQCLVCDRVFSEEQIQAARPRRCTVNRKIDHIHRHLCYLPYECVKCKEEGKEFLVAYFESKAHSHIKLKHPQIDDTESRWFIFQKTISISKLDEFIANYLTKFGISMEYERRPIKKQSRETFSSSDFLNAYKSNSVIPSPMMNSATLMLLSEQTASESEIFRNNNNESVIILDGDEDDVDLDHSQANSSITSEEQIDANSMIISVSPSHAEYIESGKNVRKDSQEYCCLFCPATFSCKLDAYPHFGEHLEYKPVICLICSTKYHDIDTFTHHHQLNHSEASDLMYEIREDQNIENWVDEFLESQQTTLSFKLKLNCPCAAFCPVCEKMNSSPSSPSSSNSSNKYPSTLCSVHDDLAFSEHIHRHMIYYSYECSFCRKIGRLTRVFNLDTSALHHIQKFHFVKEANFYQISRAFPKTLIIAKLEKFIAELLQKKKLFERTWRMNRISQSSKLFLKEPQSNSTVINQLQYPSSNGVSSNENDNFSYPNSSLLNKVSSSSNKVSGTNHSCLALFISSDN